MRTPIKAERRISAITLGIGYYIPVNVYERIYAKWESLLDDLRFRVFLLRNRYRYVRKCCQKDRDAGGGEPQGGDGPISGHQLTVIRESAVREFRLA